LDNAAGVAEPQSAVAKIDKYRLQDSRQNHDRERAADDHEVKRAEEYPEGDFRRTDPRYQGENYEANVKAARMVHDIGAAEHVKAGQIALAWLLHKGEDIVPIPTPSAGNILKRMWLPRPSSLIPHR
jgi:hypothetical protein